MIQTFRNYLWIIGFFLTHTHAISAARTTCESLPPDASDSPTYCEENSPVLHEPVQNSDFYGYYVKFSIFLNNSGELESIRFQNSNKFKFHAEYLTTVPPFTGQTPQQIDAQTLRREGRKAYIGTALILKGPLGSPVNAHFEVISQDSLSIDEVVRIQNLLRQSSLGYFNELSYRPVPDLREGVRSELGKYAEAGIKVVFPEVSTRTICYHSDWGIGRVKILNKTQMESAIERGELDPTDFLVLEDLPRELPPVAGVITSTETTPSSHVALLADLYRFPFIYEKDAHLSSQWKSLEGKWIYLQNQGNLSACNMMKIDSSDFTPVEIQRLRMMKQPQVSNPPSIDLSLKQVVPVQTLTAGDTPKVGAKAVNVGFLVNNLPAENAPVGAAIPISYYFRYLDEAKVDGAKTLREFLNERIAKAIQPETSRPEQLAILAQIRETFKSTPIPESILTELKLQIHSFFPNESIRLRLRSSSNAEDTREFNGAGLYDSVGFCPADAENSTEQTSRCDSNDKPDPMGKGLNKVWRSLYNDRAFLARKWFNFDESKIGMGVLINPSFQGELANGVSIFQKVDAASSFTARITGFPGEDMEVTSPPPGKIPETVTVTGAMNPTPGDNSFVNLEVASTEVPAGRWLLEQNEYREFYDLMTRIYTAWNQTRTTNPVLDFEWKITLDPQTQRRIPVIKQVREVPIKPYLQNQDLFILGNRNLELKSELGEVPDGLLRLFTGVRINLKFSLFTLADIQAGMNPIESATLSGYQSTYDLSTNAKVEIQSSEWAEERDRETQELKTYRREHEITFALPNPEIPSLRLLLRIYERKSVDDRLLSNEVILTQYQELSFSANREDFPFLSEAQDPTNTMVSWRAYKEESGPDSTPVQKVDTSQVFQGINVLDKKTWMRLSLHSRGVTGEGSDIIVKTVFRELERSSISGVLSRGLSVRDTRAMAYAPAHHNFSDEYAIDLTRARNMNPRLAQELAALGGNFLVISTQFDPEEIKKAIAGTIMEKKPIDHASRAVYISNAREIRKLVGYVRLDHGP